MAKTRQATGGLTEAQRTGSFISALAFFVTMFLYYVFLQGFVPQQFDFIAPIGLACIVYFTGISVAEYIALRKVPGDVERKNNFRRNIRATAWFFAGICLIGALNVIAIYLDIAISSLVNLILVLASLALAWYLSGK